MMSVDDFLSLHVWVLGVPRVVDLGSPGIYLGRPVSVPNSPVVCLVVCLRNLLVGPSFLIVNEIVVQ